MAFTISRKAGEFRGLLTMSLITVVSSVRLFLQIIPILAQKAEFKKF